MFSRRIDISGHVFGRLVVVEYDHTSSDGQAMWACLCECGRRRVVRRTSLTSGRTLSCGCLSIQRSAERARGRAKHGEAQKTPEYRVWRRIKRACTVPGSMEWEGYGSRGIAMHAPWVDNYADFVAYVGRRPSGLHSLDRIDNDRGYEPGNVRWATAETQAQNKRNTTMVMFRGRRVAAVALAREVGLSPATVKTRLRAGWDVERTFTTPGRTA